MLTTSIQNWRSTRWRPFTLTIQHVHCRHHHPEHRYRSWPTQMTSPSHLHTHVRVQQRNTYNHTYIFFCLDKTKHISHYIHTKQLALCSLQTLQTIRAIWTYKYTTLHNPWQRTQKFWALP